MNANFDLYLRFTLAAFIGFGMGLGIGTALWCFILDIRRTRAQRLADKMDPTVRHLVSTKQIRR